MLEPAAHGFLTGNGHEGAPDAGLIVSRGQLVIVRQVHSARAVAVSAPFAPGTEPEADAMATATPGLVLGVVTADCAPVLLADIEAGVIGAAHAGWRGAVGGVLEAAIVAMEQLGAQRGRIRAVIGPTIAQASYEVDESLRDRFISLDPANADLFAGGRTRHFQFDLPAFVRRSLLHTGIGAVADLALDTYADPQRFHSYRRATHRGEPAYGRQYSLIGLNLSL